RPAEGTARPAALPLGTVLSARSLLGVDPVAAGAAVGQRVHADPDAREHRRRHTDRDPGAQTPPGAGRRLRGEGRTGPGRVGPGRVRRGTPYGGRPGGAGLVRPGPAVPPAFGGRTVIRLPGVGVPPGRSHLRHDPTV